MLQTSTPEAYSEQRYQQAVSAYRRGQDSSEIFAMRCQWFREQMPPERHHLLFVPVGKTLQAPILACLAAPAQLIILLCSQETETQGRQIMEILGNEFSFRLRTINPVQGASVVDVVQATYEAEGCPANVVCDQTGGQKPTSAALAGIAAINNWKMLYIDSRHESESQLIHSERPLWLPNLFESFGGIHRWVAQRCLRHGAVEPALAEVEQALTLATVSKPLLELRRKLRLARLLRSGRLDAFVRALPRAQRARLEQVEGYEAGLVFWLVHCLWREEQQLAAEAIAHRHWGNTQVPELLRTKKVEHSRSIRALRWLDQEYGSGISR